MNIFRYPTMGEAAEQNNPDLPPEYGVAYRGLRETLHQVRFENAEFVIKLPSSVDLELQRKGFPKSDKTTLHLTDGAKENLVVTQHIRSDEMLDFVASLPSEGSTKKPLVTESIHRKPHRRYKLRADETIEVEDQDLERHGIADEDFAEWSQEVSDKLREMARNKQLEEELGLLDPRLSLQEARELTELLKQCYGYFPLD